MQHEIKKVRNGFRASLQMLETLEASLEPILEKTGADWDFELAEVFRTHARDFVEGLIAADRVASPAEEEAYETLFDEPLTEISLKAYAEDEDFEEVVDELVRFVDWVGGFEVKITELVDGASSLEGLTADLVDTLELLGVSLFLDDQEDTDRAMRLTTTIEKCREVLEQRGLSTDESVFDD